MFECYNWWYVQEPLGFKRLSDRAMKSMKCSEATNERSCISAPSVCLHALDRDAITFTSYSEAQIHKNGLNSRGSILMRPIVTLKGILLHGHPVFIPSSSQVFKIIGSSEAAVRHVAVY